jgi:hypothetical protein
MAKKTTAAQQVVAPEVAAEATEQIVDTTTENTEETTEETLVEKAKRERGYSQTAINKEDLERLNAFKINIKETRKLSVSNQVILAAALDCLADNMDGFLKKLVADASDKQRAKDLKAFEALKQKLALDEPTDEVTTDKAA